MTSERKIAVITQTEGLLFTNIAKYCMDKRQIGVEYFQHAAEALAIFSVKRYPLIVSTFEVPSGNFDEDPELRKVHEQAPEGHERYAHIGLHMIRRIRQSGANRETPIIVADIYDSIEDSLHEDVNRRCIEAGATMYFPLFWGKGNRLAVLADEIDKRAQW